MTGIGRPRNEAEAEAEDDDDDVDAPELYEDVESDEIGTWLFMAEFDRMYHGLPIDGKPKKGKRF
jgi:hypothetical protein